VSVSTRPLGAIDATALPYRPRRIRHSAVNGDPDTEEVTKGGRPYWYAALV
jgi:hypothetical protein